MFVSVVLGRSDLFVAAAGAIDVIVDGLIAGRCPAASDSSLCCRARGIAEWRYFFTPASLGLSGNYPVRYRNRAVFSIRELNFSAPYHRAACIRSAVHGLRGVQHHLNCDVFLARKVSRFIGNTSAGRRKRERIDSVHTN